MDRQTDRLTDRFEGYKRERQETLFKIKMINYFQAQNLTKEGN